MGTWLSSLIFHEMTASTGASILRLVGRHQELPSSLREELVTRALAGVDVELRDAAVQAVDQWGDTKLLRMLRQHREPAIWIREYLERVIADLEAAEP
jgi:plasmid replication initiation protein